MKYLGIMIVAICLIVACGEQDPDSIIIVGPDGKPIDAGHVVNK